MTTLRLFQAVMRPNVRGEMVLRIIQDDGALVAGVIRAANNSTDEQVHSLRAATSSSVGARRIARLGIAVSLTPLYKVMGFEESAEAIWLHARTSAVYAEELARRLGEHTEMSFCTALLRNVGQLLVLHAIRRNASTAGIATTPMAVQKVLEDLGGASGPKVAKAWKLPKPVAAATADLKKIAANDPYLPFLRVAHLAQLMARHGGAPGDAVLAANTLASGERFPTHLLKLLGGRHDEFVARAQAMSGERLRKRYAA